MWQFQGVLNAGLQVLLIVFSGWAFSRFDLLEPDKFGPQMNVLLLRVGFTSLNMYQLGIKLDLKDADTWKSLGAYALWVAMVQAGILVYTRFFNGRNLRDAALLNLVLTSNNTVIIGLPVLAATFPEAGGPLALLSALPLFVQAIPFSIVMFEADKVLTAQDAEKEAAAAAAVAAAPAQPPQPPQPPQPQSAASILLQKPYVLQPEGGGSSPARAIRCGSSNSSSSSSRVKLATPTATADAAAASAEHPSCDTIHGDSGYSCPRGDGLAHSTSAAAAAAVAAAVAAVTAAAAAATDEGTAPSASAGGTPTPPPAGVGEAVGGGGGGGSGSCSTIASTRRVVHEVVSGGEGCSRGSRQGSGSSSGLGAAGVEGAGGGTAGGGGVGGVRPTPSPSPLPSPSPAPSSLLLLEEAPPAPAVATAPAAATASGWAKPGAVEAGAAQQQQQAAAPLKPNMAPPAARVKDTACVVGYGGQANSSCSSCGGGRGGGVVGGSNRNSSSSSSCSCFGAVWERCGGCCCVVQRWRMRHDVLDGRAAAGAVVPSAAVAVVPSAAGAVVLAAAPGDLPPPPLPNTSAPVAAASIVALPPSWRQWWEARRWVLTVARTVAKNPLLLAILTGLLVNLSGLRQWLWVGSPNYVPGLGWIGGALAWTAGITVPTSLFANGVWMYGKSFSRHTWIRAARLLCLKLLLLAPLQLACAAACGLPGPAAVSVLMLSLTPVASASFVLSSQYGGYGTDVVTAVTLLGVACLVPAVLAGLALPRALGLYQYQVEEAVAAAAGAGAGAGGAAAAAGGAAPGAQHALL